jgi:hypothetical protein
MQRRLEFIRAEDAKFFPVRRDLEHQSHLESRPLKIRNANAVDAAAQANIATDIHWRMHAVIIDDHAIVDIEARAIV